MATICLHVSQSLALFIHCEEL